MKKKKKNHRNFGIKMSSFYFLCEVVFFFFLEEVISYFFNKNNWSIWIQIDNKYRYESNIWIQMDSENNFFFFCIREIVLLF